MAKPKKAKIKLSVPDSRLAALPTVDNDGMPAYKRYADSLNHTHRIFFEHPQSPCEVSNSQYPNKSYIGGGKYTGKRTGFLIVEDGRELVGDKMPRTFAQLIIKKLSQKEMSHSAISNCKGTIKHFFTFLNSLNSPPRLVSDLNTSHFSLWFDSTKADKAKTNKSNIKILLDLHPVSKVIKLDSIRIKEENKKTTKPIEVDFDDLVGEKDYSDKVMMQILAYVFYEIQQAQDHDSAIESTTIEEIGDNYIPLHEINVKNRNISTLLDNKTNGYNLILKHIYIHIRSERDGVRKYPSLPNYSQFIARIRKVSSSIYKNQHNPYNDIEEKLNSITWPIVSTDKQGSLQFFKYLSQKSEHHELAILIYSMAMTGLNLETVKSWRNNINGKRWFENFDVELGITENTAPRDKSIVLTGFKNKGKGAKKTIETSIQINSPLYKYLIFLDKTRPQNRKYIFSIQSEHDKLKAFTKNYQITDDYGNELETIHTRRLRKVYAGHKFISLLKDVKSADELVAKLKEALNHNKFDTTLFSYILQSGVGNLLINTAIVALTSDLLEKALTFKGKIKNSSERSKDNHEVFLCDCTDPSNPSHELPISSICKKYDMCLGCERSEVYAEHLPAICYRAMQYEDNQKSNPDLFKATLEDRLHIARDTIEQFKIRHKDGVKLVENAYIKANDAMNNNSPLLPPILQFGSL